MLDLGLRTAWGLGLLVDPGLQHRTDAMLEHDSSHPPLHHRMETPGTLESPAGGAQAKHATHLGSKGTESLFRRCPPASNSKGHSPPPHFCTRGYKLMPYYCVRGLVDGPRC